MKRGHVPFRTCKGCGRRTAKTELIRLVWSDGALQEDLDARLPGRSVYSCKNERCRKRLAKKRNMLRRAFRLHA
ncbi:MAG: DUF448 domain-containing protein [Candidatus Electrothrix sp. AR4]|nr:DUF448 domain-containing protein [Candidatus Electrothrix sp. AR4]